MATKPFAPQPDPIKDAAEDTAGEFVMMHFPRKVILTLQNFHFVTFNPGPQKVPVSLADHDWLKRNGAKKIDSTAVAPAKSEAELKAEQEAAATKEAETKAKIDADAKVAAAAVAKAEADAKAKADAEAKAAGKGNGKSK